MQNEENIFFYSYWYFSFQATITFQVIFLYVKVSQIRVANRPEFFGTVPNSAAVSRVPHGSIRDRLMSQIFTEQKLMSTRILISGF